jgi:hypothetical protein
MTQHYSLDSGRTYVHKTCGAPTIISGKDFARLCNPFATCLGTMCASCGGIDSTNNFHWQDTQESVSDFRKRLRRNSPKATLYTWILAPVLGAVVGGTLAAMFKSPHVNQLVSVIIFAAFGVFILYLIAPEITGIVAGKRFYDQP